MALLSKMFRSPALNSLGRYLHSHVLRRPSNPPTEVQTVTAMRAKMKSLSGASATYGDKPADRSNLQQKLAKSQSELPVRNLYYSYDEAIIPLRHDVNVREDYYNAFHRVRFGRLLEDLDMFAVWLVYRHVAESNMTMDSTSPLSIVTGMVDRIDIETRKIPTDRDIRLRGLVTWVGSSSAETMVLMEQENPETGGWDQILEARFVLVARDPVKQQKAFINPLAPIGPEEEALFAASKANNESRRLWSDESLFNKPPNAEETRIIHDQFLTTVDPKESVFSTRIKPPNSVWLDEAKLKNVHICHPQNRNIYGKVFGGFLMRNAFELAWSNAYLHCGSRPITLTVDDIKFRRAVEIGSLLMMSARLVYTEGSDMQMRVHAEVIDPATQKCETTNTFYFTFRDSSGQPVKTIIPKTYADSMMYLTGRRHYAASKHYQRLIQLVNKPQAEEDVKLALKTSCL